MGIRRHAPVGRGIHTKSGTWTPTYGSSSGSFSTLDYNSLTAGTYVRQGNLVWLQGHISTDSVTVDTASGTLTIRGLPYAVSEPDGGTVNAQTCALYGVDWDNGSTPSVGLLVSSVDPTRINMYQTDTTTHVATAVADMTTGANTAHNQIRLSGVYYTEDVF